MDFGIFAMVHQYHGRWSTQGISSGAHSLSLWKKTSHPSLVIYFFATPPIKQKLGQEKMEGTTNSKPFGLIHHYDGPFKTTDRQSDRIYDTLFGRCTPLPRLLSSHRKLWNYAEPKPFCLSETDICWPLSECYCPRSDAEPSWRWS